MLKVLLMISFFTVMSAMQATSSVSGYVYVMPSKARERDRIYSGVALKPKKEEKKPLFRILYCQQLMRLEQEVDKKGQELIHRKVMNFVSMRMVSKTIQQSTVWVFQDEPKPAKVIRAKSTLKQMVARFMVRMDMGLQCHYRIVKQLNRSDTRPFITQKSLKHKNSSNIYVYVYIYIYGGGAAGGVEGGLAGTVSGLTEADGNTIGTVGSVPGADGSAVGGLVGAASYTVETVDSASKAADGLAGDLAGDVVGGFPGTVGGLSRAAGSLA
ncbi:hypothetical protein EVAR_13838_1 [Eumeta japonica]|uniref:Uncharacterized protein n=1 Tax=Eumeta variegata TaxID=151549 RepID=A0A4C1U2K7_EUMVA|nr:hypothetical protein EVAR_13838_1 [Eumeta japonica]